MRLLTKAEACRELRLSLSTLNRRIAAGEVVVKREQRGRRHRVYVMLDDDLPSAAEPPQSELVAAQERILGLEEQVATLQGQLDGERQHNAGLPSGLNARERTRPWWRVWERNGRWEHPPTLCARAGRAGQTISRPARFSPVGQNAPSPIGPCPIAPETR